MFRTRLKIVSAVVAVSVAVLPGGCGVGTSPLTGLLSSLDPNMTLGQLLDEVEQMMSSRGNGANPFAPPGPPDVGGFPGDPNGKGGLAALNLTDEQESEANAIFTSAREDVDALQQDANDQIRALLTADQCAILDDLQPNSPNHVGPPPRGPYGPPPCPLLDNSLNLTDEQKTAIKAILDQLRTDIEARQQKALDAFRAILTTDQQAILDQMPQPPSPGSAPAMGGGPPMGPGGAWPGNNLFGPPPH
jgi:Spy/CpxP family protein refolding chaperone